jgi:DtxR family Mn-dependent transcriptional regulator
MVRKLQKMNLAQKNEKNGIRLSPKGRRLALELIRKHRLSECLVVNALSLPWETAHQEACRLEHVLSSEVADALSAFLRYPKTCPHGYPIPDTEGRLPKDDSIPLSSLSLRKNAEIARVPEDSPEILRHLRSLGIVPGNCIRINERGPFGGALLADVSGRPVAISGSLAGKVRVRPLPDQTGG